MDCFGAFAPRNDDIDCETTFSRKDIEMPFMIVIVPGLIPLVAEKDDPQDLLDLIAACPGAPPAASTGFREARLWLATLQPPSGFYDTVEEAEAATQSVTKGRQ